MGVDGCVFSLFFLFFRPLSSISSPLVVPNVRLAFLAVSPPLWSQTFVLPFLRCQFPCGFSDHQFFVSFSLHLSGSLRIRESVGCSVCRSDLREYDGGAAGFSEPQGEQTHISTWMFEAIPPLSISILDKQQHVTCVITCFFIMSSSPDAHAAADFVSCVPSSLNRKSTSDNRESVLHPNVNTYLYQWVWREHVLKAMGPQERMELLSALF